MIVVFLADEHSGHNLGLCNPETVLWDEGPDGEPAARYPKVGEVQRHFWQYYVKCIKKIKKLADGEPIVLINDGDLTHGIKYPDGLMTLSVDDQTQIAYWNLRPWFDECNVETCRLLQGTYAHTFDGSTEAIITRLLRAYAPKADIKTVSHSKATIYGVVFDTAHHRAHPGSKNHLKGNVAKQYVQSYVADELDRGKRPADFVLGAHYHEWIEPVTYRKRHEGVIYESTLVLLPSWCSMSGHGRQATRSQPYVQYGLVAFEIKKKHARIIPLVKELDLRMEETIG